MTKVTLHYNLSRALTEPELGSVADLPSTYGIARVQVTPGLDKIIAKKMASAPVALLFGSEKFGLSNEDMSYCHWLMRIPTREEHGSMNLGQAVAVCLYEIIRNPAAVRAQPEAKRAASAAEMERVTALLEEVLEHSGYVHQRVEGSTKIKIRRLVRRMELNAHDAEVWLGMLRQIKWKLLN